MARAVACIFSGSLTVMALIHMAVKISRLEAELECCRAGMLRCSSVWMPLGMPARMPSHMHARMPLRKLHPTHICRHDPLGSSLPSCGAAICRNIGARCKEGSTARSAGRCVSACARICTADTYIDMWSFQQMLKRMLKMCKLE